MMASNVLPYRFRRRRATYPHNRAIRGSEQTLPRRQAQAGLMSLSMLRQHGNMSTYLVTVRSSLRLFSPADAQPVLAG